MTGHGEGPGQRPALPSLDWLSQNFFTREGEKNQSLPCGVFCHMPPNVAGAADAQEHQHRLKAER